MMETEENGNLKDYYGGEADAVKKKLHEMLLRRKEKRKDVADEPKGLLE